MSDRWARVNTGLLLGLLLAFEPWQTTQMFAPVQDAAATARGLTTLSFACHASFIGQCHLADGAQGGDRCTTIGWFAEWLRR